MLDQNIFTETVREVSEIIRTAPSPLTREEILSYFKDMELNEEQQETVFTYLITPHEEPEDETTEQNTAEAQDAEPINETTDVYPDSKMFQMYMEEINELPVYGKEELQTLYVRLLEGDNKAVKTLSDAWLMRVLKLAEKTSVSAEHFEDIVQEGNMGLFLRLSELCGSGAGVDVEQELLDAIEMSMQAYIFEYAGENDGETSVLGKINLINEAKKYLTEENGMEPTAAELADYTKMTEEELAELIALMEKAKGEKKS